MTRSARAACVIVVSMAAAALPAPAAAKPPKKIKLRQATIVVTTPQPGDIQFAQFAFGNAKLNKKAFPRISVGAVSGLPPMSAAVITTTKIKVKLRKRKLSLTLIDLGLARPLTPNAPIPTDSSKVGPKLKIKLKIKKKLRVYSQWTFQDPNALSKITDPTMLNQNFTKIFGRGFANPLKKLKLHAKAVFDTGLPASLRPLDFFTNVDQGAGWRPISLPFYNWLEGRSFTAPQLSLSGPASGPFTLNYDVGSQTLPRVGFWVAPRARITSFQGQANCQVLNNAAGLWTPNSYGGCLGPITGAGSITLQTSPPLTSASPGSFVYLNRPGVTQIGGWAPTFGGAPSTGPCHQSQGQIVMDPGPEYLYRMFCAQPFTKVVLIFPSAVQAFNPPAGGTCSQSGAQLTCTGTFAANHEEDVQVKTANSASCTDQIQANFFDNMQGIDSFKRGFCQGP